MRTPRSWRIAAWATIDSSFWATRSSTTAVARFSSTSSIRGRHLGSVVIATDGTITPTTTAGRSGLASRASLSWNASSRPATATSRSRCSSRARPSEARAAHSR